MTDQQAIVTTSPDPGADGLAPAIEAIVQMNPGRRFHAWVERTGEAAALECLLEFICGGGHLAGFCRDNGFGYYSAWRWIAADAKRRAAYDVAREDRADFLAEKIHEESAKDCRTPILDDAGKIAGYKTDPGAVQQQRLIVDSLKWEASKLKPRVYGDKVDVSATVDLRTATNEQLAGELAKMGLGAVAAKLLRVATDQHPADGDCA